MDVFVPALLRKLAHDVRASYWAVPSAMALAALAAAIGCEILDRRGLTGWLPQVLFATDASAARSVVGTISSAAIGAAGVMFSMTMVAVSFASSNFGPRLIGNFMQDRGVQFSLGALLGTFVFTLSVLRGIRDAEDGSGYAFVPALSLSVSLGLAFLSVAVLIYFVHHIPELISLENVTERLGRKLLRAIARLTPLHASEIGAGEIGSHAEDLALEQTGYIQALDLRRLGRLAARNGWRLEPLRSPGDFVGPHVPVLRVGAPNGLGARDRARLRACFATGAGRTEDQNPAFLAHQLVEIIARALSPGINDPITAMNCLNWLHAALHQLAQTGPLDAMGAEEAALRRGTLNFSEMLRQAHADPRPYIAADPMTACHAYRLLKTLEQTLPAGPRRDAVAREIVNLVIEALTLCPGNAEVAAMAAGEPLAASEVARIADAGEVRPHLLKHFDTEGGNR